MADCGGQFIYNRHDQFVKDGGAMEFYAIYTADFWLSTIRHQ